MIYFILGLLIGAFIVWFFKPGLIRFWVWATPFIKRGEASLIAEANKVLKKKP